MLASWSRSLWGDGLPAQALIMGTRLPNIEHGGAGGQTLKRLALFLCFPNFASHVRTHRTTSFFNRLYPIWSPGLSLLDHPHAHFLGYEQEEDVSDKGTRIKRPLSGRWTLGDLGS